jgi:acyl-CoA dehydrogenase
MLMMAGNEEQKKRYMEPYAQGEIRSNIAISEPQAGADPAAMRTRAVRDGDEWVINGRKIWVSGAASADFIILMAVTDPDLGARGMTAFIVEKDTPGYVIERAIPMLGGVRTYELVFDDMRIGDSQVLGEVNKGYAPMQHRLTSRRLEMGGTCIALAERALKMMCEHVQDRVVFGETLASKQAIQWWIADAEIAIHATRLMVDDAIAKVDRGDDIRNEASMIKVYATEMAGEVIDHAMQSFGAMGMTEEFPLYLMAQRIRLARIYEGPTEAHRMVVARRTLAKYPTS